MKDSGMPARPSPRFIPLAEVAEVLGISVSQVYALVRRADLPAIKIGGRGQWRVEASELENYITKAYESTRQFIAQHPFVGDDPNVGEPDAEPPDLPPDPLGADGEAAARDAATSTTRDRGSPRRRR